ncbi:MAG: cellulase family glycosylhydrolase, partial [Ignavibacteriales bacterium]|nr:cellulase family glycosylhydrolase [Ignavibacteriales bacterium]
MKPNLSRRSFLKSVGNAAIAGAATSLPALAAPVRALTHGRRLSLCILHETSFPTLNTLPIHGELIQKAFADCEIHFISAAEFVQSDALNHCDVLVTPYGSAFPKDCFLRLSAFLNEGGNWLNLGGTPLLVPVSRKNGSWVPEVPQPAYGKKLGILHSFPVDVPSLPGFLASAHFPEAAGLEKECVVKEAFELYVRFTSKKDHPDEDGSDGPREAKLSPIMRLIDAAGRPVAAPFVCIDRLKGKYSGGRWVFAAMNGELTSHAIRCLADIAAASAFEFGVNASYACYREGETPSFSIYCRRPKGMLEEILPEPAHVQIFSEARVLLGEGEIPMQGIGSSKAGSGAIAMKKKRALPPGLYHVRAAVFYRSPVTGAKQTAAAENGFWIYDEKLIAAGAPLTTDAHSFYRNGKPFPITGTTYMASDVHRKFLFEPNPHVWDADFREMKHAGVNVVRTGIWTGYRDYMPRPGAMAESPLRALDAFILTAKKYDIPVIFTFFAFLPETWGGKNPFLDPAAIAAQKEFVTAIAVRYPQADDLMWDLINEPSFSSSSQLWSVRPNYDRYEAESWEQWVAARHPASSAGERNALLQELWHTTPEDSLGLPQL